MLQKPKVLTILADRLFNLKKILKRVLAFVKFFSVRFFFFNWYQFAFFLQLFGAQKKLSNLGQIKNDKT